ncbi:Pimeloyl-[acyl-carrier protein] methyl ester esterase [Mixta theicola]|nr:pimeloyl-ACP methyl ester esterase BioH [Mixta theicola]QHM77195.1 Pimeloyl-[acyl-carrier protein] methyl ester esterase [Mixta theicola]
MTQLYWHTIGTGDRNLVLLHGWGLNAEVWRCIAQPLSAHFRLHLVDLPGFGRSQGFGALRLEEMAALLLPQLPEKSLVLGWSLGGLVASQLALRYPQRVEGLISVASSPCFTAQGDCWPGIKPDTLAGFQQQLSENYQRTVERFLALQTLGAQSARQDARMLKEVVLSQPFPAPEVLAGGLDILRYVDLRSAMDNLQTPLLRIYGSLDGLVPRKVAALLDERWPQSASLIIEKAAHAPFVSHPQAFCEAVARFGNSV